MASGLNIIDQFKCFGVRLTPARLEIYRIFNNSECALSHADIENATRERFDRVTIYRTLDLFLDKKIIHKILDDQGIARYGRGGGKKQIAGRDAEHLHFKCLQCGKTFCLEAVEIPHFTFPKSFHIQTLNISAEGTCSECTPHLK